MLEIKRYLNGTEISAEELYSVKTVTDEMKTVLRDVRERVSYSDKDDCTDAEG